MTGLDLQLDQGIEEKCKRKVHGQRTQGPNFLLNRYHPSFPVKPEDILRTASHYN